MRADMPEMPKPVAWRYVPSDHWRETVVTDNPEKAQLAQEFGREVMPLYTADQMREFANEATRQAMEGHEKMRGGKPVAFWRDDALEAAAGIAEAYQANPQIAIDIRAMKSRLKEWWRGPSPATGSES